MDNQMDNKIGFRLSVDTTDFFNRCQQPYEGQTVFNIDTLKMMVYLNHEWVELYDVQDDASYKKLYPTTCPNCGAPHNPESKICEYCGTYFE